MNQLKPTVEVFTIMFKNYLQKQKLCLKLNFSAQYDHPKAFQSYLKTG